MSKQVLNDKNQVFCIHRGPVAVIQLTKIMSDWFRVSLLLCFFGFLKEIRPSELFVVEYLTPPWRDITLDEVNRYLWPMATYSMLAIQIVMLILTDYLRYKPIIVFGSICAIITFAILVWTTSFFWAAALQLTYGAYVASEVAYFAYIYAKVDKKHYLNVTSYTRAALLSGKLVSGLIGQTVVSTKILDLRQLTMCTLAFQIVATMYASILPSVQNSLYFNRTPETPLPIFNISLDPTVNGNNVAQPSSHRHAFQMMRKQIVQAYSMRSVIFYSIWYAAGFCGYLQVISYVQVLWIVIDNRPEMIWNGAVEACATLLGAASALLASRMHQKTSQFRTMLWILMSISIVQAGVLCAATNTNTRLVSYPCYICFCVLHAYTITICGAEIAKRIPDDSYGLIFGLNTAFGIFIQVVLTFIVVNGALGWHPDVIDQFNVYAGFYFLLAAVYLIVVSRSYLDCFENK